MTRSIVPFRSRHLDWLEKEGLPKGGWISLSTEQRRALEYHASWTAVIDGSPVACGGTVQLWPGRHSAWAYLNERSRPYMLYVTRTARQCLAQVKGRIEMTVRIDFDEGKRWAKMLDFNIEHPCLVAYGPEGESHVSFVRHN